MRSLIILEVEHGETTDDLQSFAESITRYAFADTERMCMVTDWTVRVDIPECFTLGE